jgi:hypothetical protein
LGQFCRALNSFLPTFKALPHFHFHGEFCESTRKYLEDLLMSKLPEMINKHQEEIRTDWLKQMNSSVRRADLMSNEELEAQSRELMSYCQGSKVGRPCQPGRAGMGRGAGHPGRNLRIAGKTGLYHQ